MPLVLKTVGSVWKFCQKLPLECTKLMKVVIFLELELDTTDVNGKDVAQLHFGIIAASFPGSLILPPLGALWGGKMRDLGNEVGIIEGLATSLCHACEIVYSSWICINYWQLFMKC